MGSGLAKMQLPRVGIKAEKNAFDGCPAKGSIVFRGGRAFNNKTSSDFDDVTVDG